MLAVPTNSTLEALGVNEAFIQKLKNFWTRQNLKLDLPVIDLQHIWLVYLILVLETESNQFLAGDISDDGMKKIEGDLLNFAVEHFNLEEDIFEKFGVPDAVEHTARHRDFCNFISERAAEIRAGKRESVKMLIQFLMDWLSMHIQREDRDYVEFLRQKKTDIRAFFQDQVARHNLTIDRGQVAVYRLVSESEEVHEIVNDNIVSNVIKIWNANKLSVNIPIIDLQHIWLIRLVVELDIASRSRSMQSSQRETIFQRVVQGAVQYAADHFSTEEDIMQHFGFPGYANHVRQHQSFREFLARRVGEHAAGDTQAAIRLVNDLREWLLSHIAIEDRNIAAALKNSLGDIQKYVREKTNSGRIVIRKRQVELYNKVCGLQKI